MDTLLSLRPRTWHATDWTAAAVAGFAAGAVLMVLDLIWSAIFAPHGPWRTSHMIAPIFLGADTLPVAAYPFSVLVVSIALAAHYALGILFGLMLGAVMAQLRLDASPVRASGTGVVFGVLLYLLNFGIGPAIFPWLADLRGADTLAAHVVFGATAALLYWRLKRTVSES
jgi:hypothetical protein